MFISSSELLVKVFCLGVGGEGFLRSKQYLFHKTAGLIELISHGLYITCTDHLLNMEKHLEVHSHSEDVECKTEI